MNYFFSREGGVPPYVSAEVRFAHSVFAYPTQEPTEKVPITAFLSIFSVTLFKNYRKRTLKILRSEVFQWPPTQRGQKIQFAFCPRNAPII